MHVRHHFLNTVAAVSNTFDSLINRGLIRWVRSQFTWDYVGCYGIWGYWENRLTGRRTCKRIRLEGTGRRHLSWLAGGPWDHKMYPMGELGYGQMDLHHAQLATDEA